MGTQYYDGSGGTMWAPAVEIDDAVRAHASYAAATWSVGASYERLQREAVEGQEFLYVSGRIDVTPRIAVAGAMGHAEENPAVASATGTGYHAGVFYRVVPGAHLNALYSHLDADSGSDRQSATVGLTYQFVLGP